MLATKSITELRGIALAMGCKFSFGDDKSALLQKIESKRTDALPPPKVEIPQPEYDPRLMTRPPSKNSTEEQVKELLVNHIAKGLHLTFPAPERWRMQYGIKEDTGTLRMPLRVVIGCAEKLMR